MTNIFSVEIKAGKTFQPEFRKNITWLNKLQNQEEATCVYGVDNPLQLGAVSVVPWHNL